MHATSNEFGTTIHRWTIGSSSFRAAPTLGARLMDWKIDQGKERTREVIYWPSAVSDLAQIASIRGGNPVLFPFAGRSHDEGEPGFWRHAGRRLPMPQHGFARQGTFQLLETEHDGFIAGFVPDAVTRDAYPFEYKFTVRYRFRERSMTVEFCLTNGGSVPIPWSPGQHFYFKVPWRSGTSRVDYSVTIPAGSTWRQDARGNLVAIEDVRTTENLAAPDLPFRLHGDLSHGRCTLGSCDGTERIIITFANAYEPPPGACVLTWTEHDSSPFYCVEPWLGIPNGIALGRGVTWIRPGEIGTFGVDVAVE